MSASDDHISKQATSVVTGWKEENFGTSYEDIKTV